MRVSTRVALIKWMLRDYVLFPAKSVVSGAVCFFLALPLAVAPSQRLYKALMKFDRLGPNKLSRMLVKQHKQALIRAAKSEVSRLSIDEGWVRKRSLVLRDPLFSTSGQLMHKGVYLVKFTTTFPHVYNLLDLDKLQCHFHVVLEPSWAGYCLPEILAWCNLSDPVIVQASDAGDRDLLALVGSGLVPVSFGSSDWVDMTAFHPLEEVPKIYDVIYVANYNSIKRPYAFIRALFALKKKGVSLKAALVCSKWGDCRDETLDLIDHYGLTQQIDLFESIPQREINLLLNKSKVNLLLSLKEGSNRSLFEGFFAGTPGIVLRENVGVNKDYFNKSTGLCIQEKSLKNSLIHFSTHWEEYDPATWARESIAPEITTLKLKEVVDSLEQPDNASSPISIKVNRPEAQLAAGQEIIPVQTVDDVIANYRRA